MVGLADHASRQQLCVRIYVNSITRTTEYGEPFLGEQREGNHEDAQRLALTDTTFAELISAAKSHRVPNAFVSDPGLARCKPTRPSCRCVQI